MSCEFFGLCYPRSRGARAGWVEIRADVEPLLLWVSMMMAGSRSYGARPETMKLIQANCRVQFTAEDIEFILSVLGRKAGTSETLIRLLGDEDTRDLILDDPALLHALLERRDCLRVSTHFYFYVLIRQSFLKADLLDRDVADYVAEMLAEFAQAERMRCRLPGSTASLDYFFEMISALDQADVSTRFRLRMHIGNHSLFLTGVFADRIRYRAEHRGAPGVGYYESLGRANYRAASDHQLAQRLELASILNTLADRFKDTRLALNDASERLFVLADAESSLEAFLNSQRSSGHRSGR